jgi:hypothetical protein
LIGHDSGLNSSGFTGCCWFFEQYFPAKLKSSVLHWASKGEAQFSSAINGRKAGSSGEGSVFYLFRLPYWQYASTRLTNGVRTVSDSLEIQLRKKHIFANRSSYGLCWQLFSYYFKDFLQDSMA